MSRYLSFIPFLEVGIEVRTLRVNMLFGCSHLFHQFVADFTQSPSPTGYATFALEFHLPYYAWRSSKSMVEDIRKRADGRPLRHSEEVMYPARPGLASLLSKSQSQFLYQSQISVMITGIDCRVWTAYCIVDVYFEDKNSERVEHYSNCPEGAVDPHFCGRYPANSPALDPRLYFLRTLSARVNQVRKELENSVLLLMHQIDSYVCSFPPIEVT
jgi:hypothetical protein